MEIVKGQKKEKYSVMSKLKKIILFSLICVSIISFGDSAILNVQAAEAEDAVEYISELELNTLVEAKLDPIKCRQVTYKFVPQSTGEYVFYAVSDREEYTAGALLSASGTSMSSASSGKRGDFALQCQLIEGETYYFRAQYSNSSDASGTILVGIKWALSDESFDSSQELTGTTDGVMQSTDKETKSARVRFKPEKSGYYSIFSRDYCQASGGCTQGCVCEEQGECTCLKDLKAEIYKQNTQDEGELELYKYGESYEESGFLVYDYFEKDVTYYIEISSVDGMTDGNFVLCIGTGLDTAYVKQVDITGKTEGYLEDNTVDLFYKFQPEEDGTYRWKITDSLALGVCMTFYDSDMGIVEQTPEDKELDVKVQMKKGIIYYIKISKAFISPSRFEFQTELVTEEDKEQETTEEPTKPSDTTETEDPTKPSTGTGGTTKPSTGAGGTTKPSTGTGGQTPKPTTKQPVTKKVSIRAAKLTAISSREYTGKTLKPSVKLKYKGKKLVKGKDYVLSYSSNKKIGKAKVVIKGIGKYTGKRTTSFKITPAKSKIKKGKRSGKKLTLSWSKIKGATGYEIRYSNSSKFKKAKKKTVKSCKVTLKLQNKKKYYVKIRAYKKVGKTKIYGKYSKTKKY